MNTEICLIFGISTTFTDLSGFKSPIRYGNRSLSEFSCLSF